MIQLNLVPDVKIELLKSERQRNIIIAISILLMASLITLVVLVGIYVLGIQNYEISAKERNIKKIYTDLRNDKPDVDKIVTLQNQLTAIDSTHESRLILSRLIDILAVLSAKDTENAVTINQFSLDKNGEIINIVAETDKNGFEAAEVFKKNLEALTIGYKKYDENGKVSSSNENLPDPIKFASEIRLSQLSKGTDSGSSGKVNFSLSFKYDKEAFSMLNKITDIKGLSKGNITDSYKELPKNLFGKSSQQKAMEELMKKGQEK